MNKKTKTIILISLLVLLVLSLITFMIYVIANGTRGIASFNISKNTSSKLVYDEVYQNEFNKINVKSDAANIKIKESSDDNISIVVYSDDKNTFDVSKDNDTLDINLEVEKHFFGFNYKISKIEISIPKNYDKEINIENDYGDIYVDDFTNLNVDINSDAGDIEIGDVNIATIKNSYGDTTIDKANNINIVADCGDIKIGSVSDIKAENSYGDIDIKNINNYVDIAADCGDIEIDTMTLNKNSKIKNDLGDITIKNIRNIYIDATVDLGDISINNNDRNSDITLKIENDCGDIDVN